MKTVIRKSTYEKVNAMPRTKHRKPFKPVFLIQVLIRLLAIPDMLATKFTYRTYGMEKVDIPIW